MALAYRAKAEDVVRVAASVPGQGRQYTALAVFDGERWASLCPDLDIASVGNSGQEAIDNLIAAVREAVDVARVEGLEPGRETPTNEILAFGRAHQGTEPAVSEAFILQTQNPEAGVTWSSRDVVKVLESRGFTLVRRGRHDTFKRPGHRYLVSVPRDERTLPIGTVLAIWRQADIDPRDAEAGR